MELYKNIRSRRIALKMTQQELAQKLGYKSTSTIAKILMGLNIVAPTQNLPENTETCMISKGKPQLEKLIKKLDSLSEKDLNRLLSVIKPLIENFVSDDDIHKE